jgi:regulation of enolase protein 1 (concanavalin A-like superfamily)
LERVLINTFTFSSGTKRLAAVTAVGVAMVLGPATRGEATDYYVSASGEDARSGLTPADAWRTIQRVNNQTFQPGDRILFEAGQTFSGSLYFDSADAGTSAAPVTVASFGAGRATIYPDAGGGILVYNAGGYRITDLYVVGSGRDTNTGSGIFFYNDLPGDVKLDHVVIERVDAVGFREAGILIGSNVGRSGYRNVRISRVIASHNGKQGIFTYAAVPNTHENVYVGHSAAFLNAGFAGLAFNSGNGITMSGVNGGTIERSVAYENGWRSTSGNGPIGIWTFDSTRVVIQHNESYNNKTGGTKDGGGFSLDRDTSNSILQYNYSHGNMGAGYLLAHKLDNFVHSGNVIRYNVTENDGRRNEFAAIHVWGRIRNTEIYNNTVYIASTPPGTPGLPRALWVKNTSIPTHDVDRLHFRNNIVVTKGVRAVEVSSDQLNGATDLRFENNLYFGSGSAPRFIWGATTYSGLAAWRTATGQERLGGRDVGIQADPLLTWPGGGVSIGDGGALDRLEGYQIRSGSPSIDAGLSLASSFGINPGGRDYYGTSTPQWAGMDIGAHEFSIDCTWTLDGNAAAVDAAGGSGVVRVSGTPSSCGWSAKSQVDWLYVAGSAHGSADGTLSWGATPNPLTVARTGSIIVAAQTFTVRQAPNPTSPPFVAMTSPGNGASFPSGAAIDIQAAASDSDGSVNRVDFLVNGALVGSDAAAPYGFTWTPPADGSYTLAASATDNAGLVGRSANVAVTSGTATAPVLPAPWSSQDIGAVGLAGTASYRDGTFHLSGSGADIWNTADGFRFAYRPMDGDGSIVARVASLENTHAWAKAGVMIRETLTAGSRHASMLVSAAKGLAFQRRISTDGLSTNTAGPLAAAPKWVRIARAGTTFTAAWSSDGVSWTTVGSATIAMGTSVFIGLALTSHDNATTGDATLEQVAVATAPRPPDPSGWTNHDVGAVGIAGSTTETSGVFTVKAAGADIWGTADAFHFVYRRVSGDGQIVARVASIGNTHRWAKAGVMIRDSAAAGARHAMMTASGQSGLAFLRRAASGGTSVSTAGTLSPAPMWVKLVRSGSTFTAYQSVDGAAWRLVGTQTIALPAEALWGLAVTSHNTSVLTTAVFDNVAITPGP